jgi:hypothetical protein
MGLAIVLKKTDPDASRDDGRKKGRGKQNTSTIKITKIR